jgi:hypothetical protein
MTTPFDRRSFVRLSAGSAGALCLGPQLAWSNTAETEPHFFLNLIFPGGLDSRYTFDARPLAMTEAKRFVNHLLEKPIVHTGTNGGKCLRTRLIDPIKPYMSRFSIMNGVVMMPTFDGHENNIGFMVTGNPFSGEAIMPHLNTGKGGLPLDYVQVGDGRLLTTITNTGNSVPLNAASAKSFAERLQQLPSFADTSPLKTFLGNRMRAAAMGKGRFSAGAAAMHLGYERLPRLADALKNLKVEAAEGERAIMPSVKLIGELFRGGVCRSAMFVFDTDLSENQNLDSHDSFSASEQPRIIGELMDDLAAVLQFLDTTPYDDSRSLFDVTTITVGTEFGRTMLPMFEGVPFEYAGTDHNPLTNTIMLGGKGIKGGLVLGESDCQSVKEKLSGAHLAQDPKSIKHMGRPFDFATGTVRRDLPAAYNTSDYLTYSSVANTIYKVFGLPESRFRTLDRNGPAAPVLTQLLV